jgi:hypothetical protein
MRGTCLDRNHSLLTKNSVPWSHLLVVIYEYGDGATLSLQYFEIQNMQLKLATFNLFVSVSPYGAQAARTRTVNPWMYLPSATQSSTYTAVLNSECW